MTAPFIIEKMRLYEIAEWAVSVLVLLLGLKYLKQIIEFVLMELYKFIIQRGVFVI